MTTQAEKREIEGLKVRLSAELTSTPKTLLCVDDDTHVLKSLKRLFRAENFHVLTAENSDEALALLERKTVQVVMADQRMPDMSGTQFLQQVKEKYPTTVRVVLSGYSEVGAILEAINRGEVYRFMGKPWDDKELKTTIAQCFEQYELLAENSRLLAEVQSRNDELDVLNKRLREMVKLSTKSLQLSQNVIEQIPLPLLAVSTEEKVVMLNSLANQHLEHVVLGDVIEGIFSSEACRALKQCLSVTCVDVSMVHCEKTKHQLRLAPLRFDSQLRGCLVTIGEDP